MPEQSGGGKLAVLFVGLGGLSTTTIAKCLLARNGVGTLPLIPAMPMSEDNRASMMLLREKLQLASIEDLAFGAWSVFMEDALAIANFVEILSAQELAPIAQAMQRIEPLRAVFYREYPQNLFGNFNKRLPSKSAMVEALKEDINSFLRDLGAARAVAVWCGTPEKVPEMRVHGTIREFELALAASDPSITNSQIYSWACVGHGTPFLSVAPNGCVQFPAVQQLALEKGVPLAGEGFRRCLIPVNPAAATDAEKANRREVTLLNVPLLLDAVLLLDRARRQGWAGLQHWLSLYFAGQEQDLPAQQRRLLQGLSELAASRPTPPA